jgi:SAM-dependent methyltransferase
VEESTIAAFWDTHPCGDAMVGGLSAEHRGDYLRFFEDYDAFKYGLERHIPGCIAREVRPAGKRTLEIGLGQGAESQLLIEAGADWSGLDLTAASVDRVRTRLALRGLSGEVRQGSVQEIPWPDHTFDLVFSHGVLHHVPDIQRAQFEIRRVLRPGGELVVMLYARHSINYQLSIRLLRRGMLLAAYPLARLGRPSSGLLAGHLENARRFGLFRYLRMQNFLGPNTDGPANPFSRVYDLHDVERDFPDFTVRRWHQHFLHAPPLPLPHWSGRRWGWHLWVHLTPNPEGL